MKILGSIVLVVGLAALSFSGCRNPAEPPEKPPFDWPSDWPRYNYSEPAWSLDGNFIAYEYGGNQYGTDTAGIFIFDLRDSTSRYLIYGWNPDWSPDGEWIVFVANARIWKIKVNGDSLTQLTFDRRTFFPDWSPDGKKIAYDQSATTETHPRGIWIMDADGSNDHLIIPIWRVPDWSPDGSKIAYKGIYVADTNGTNIELIHQGGGHPAWSPDGSKIAFSAYAGGKVPHIWIMNADGSNLKKLTEEGGDRPCWSPDGSKIAYTNTKLGEIWVMNPDGTEKRKLIGYENDSKKQGR